MKKTGLDIYKIHLQATDSTGIPKDDGEVLFESINRLGLADNPTPLIETLKEIGDRDEMSKEEIARLLKQAQESPVKSIVLSRGFINTLIGLCEDGIYADKDDNNNEKETITTKDSLMNKMGYVLMNPIFDYLMRKGFGLSKQEQKAMKKEADERGENRD